MYKVTKNVIFFICITLLAFNGFSQVFTNDYKITRYELPIKTSAQDILQDQYGFVWIATGNGLWRYDGGSFKNYLKNELDPTSITDNNISRVFEDSKGTLWIGTYGGGLLKYIRECDCFERFVHDPKNPESLSFNEIKVLFETSDGYFFVGTDGGGLNLMNRENKTFTSYKHSSDDVNTLSHNNVLSLEEGNVGELYVGTWKGLNLLNYKTNKVSRVLKEKKKHTSYFAIYKSPKIKGTPSWKILDTKNSSYLKLYLSKDVNGNTWLLKKNEVVVYKDFPNQKKRISLDHNFKNKHHLIKLSHTKSTGETWLVAIDGSFFRFQEKPRVFTPFLAGDLGKSIVKTSNFFWTTNRAEIVIYQKDALKEYKRFRLDKQNVHITNAHKNNQVSVVCQDYYFLFKEDGTLLRKEKREKDNTVRSFLHTTDNKLWIGEILGAQQYKAAPEIELLNQFTCSWNSEKGIGYFHRCVFLFEDSKGDVWLGTTGDGLKRYLPKTNEFEHYRHKIGDVTTINNNFVNVVFEDKQENLWIGTKSGLSKLSLKDNSIKAYNIGVLKDKIINDILQDFEGDLWIATTNGLIKFNEEKNEIRILNQEDGLISDVILDGGLLLENGDLVFRTNKGFMRFNPKKVKPSAKKAQVYLSKLWVNNNLVKPNPENKYIKRNIEVAQNLNLDYTDNKFEIAFEAIHFSNNSRCKYAYKLEGYDEDWTYTDSKNSQATYTNIPSGTYTFLVKATNEDNIWNNNYKELRICVAPPFWDLVWVRILGFLLAVALVYLIFVWFINKEKARSKFQIEKERVRQFEEVSQMKLRFFTNVSHELRTPLTLITAPLNKFSERGITPDKKVLQMMYRNSNRLLELINQILDFRKLENKQQLNRSEVKDLSVFNNIYDAYLYWANEKHIQLNKEFTNETIPQICFDVDVVQKIISNLISNAIKYTPKHGKVDFKVSFKDLKVNSQNVAEEGALLIEIKDNGLGIPEAYQQKIFERYFQLDEDAQKINSSGIGLSLCSELVTLHGGTISLDSKVNRGSHFRVTIPVGTLQNATEENRPIEEEAVSLSTDKEVLLVVEDNLDIRNYLSAELQEYYTVLTAEDGKEGVSKAVTYIPDIIISDIMMPSIDGIQLTKQLKANDLTSHIPIIFLTAKTGIDNKLTGLDSGGHDYIQKPFHISEIQLKVKNILKARKEFIKKRKDSTEEIKEVSSQDNFLIKVNKCLEMHLENSEFGVESLCQELGTSRSQLYRKLQSLTGKSIIEYINFYKLSIAMELLKQGEKSVKEIAFSVGFDDSRYFSRVFKNKFGNPPSYYIPKK